MSDKTRIHVYANDDGTFTEIELTDAEALAYDAAHYDAEMARRNQAVLSAMDEDRKHQGESGGWRETGNNE